MGVNKLINIADIFGLTSLFWSIVIMLSYIFDKEAYKKEGMPRWKVVLLSFILFNLAIIYFLI